MMIKRYGWRPSLPDHRDYDFEQALIKVNRDVGKDKSAFDEYVMANHLVEPFLPSSVDQRHIVPWINDQGDLGSCTAQAAQSMMGFMNQLAFGKTVKGSRLYLYWFTRYLMNRYRVVKGDTGADLRNVMGALVLYGIAPEQAWPYTISNFDIEPPARINNLADDYRALKYFRHDTKGKTNTQVLQSIKTQIAGRIPTIFGFTCFTSIDSADDGRIPFPGPKDAVDGGHAVLCVGYDDGIGNPGSDKSGALLIQNSWGKSWGEGGFGWLPYEYVLQGLASDFWSVTSAAFVETGQFGI